MPQTIIMPKLGQTVEEAAIVTWHKQEGDAVAKGDILFEIETDKAVLEVESFFEGTLLKILIPVDVTVPVLSVVGYIGEPGEAIPDAPPPPAPAAAPAPEQRKAEAPAASSVPAPTAPAATSAPVAQPAPAAPAAKQAPTAPAAPPPARRLFISPRAKALAKASAIIPTGIAGSGPNGRIVEKDVRDYLEAKGYDLLRITPAAKRLAIEEGVDVLTTRATGDAGRITVADIEREIAKRPQKMSRMRQVIASRLAESFGTIPHFYVTVRADMTDLLTYRQELKAAGTALSVNDFILEAVSLSLQEFPTVNSATDGREVWWRGGVDLGMAVSVESGLVVPVIRDADQLTIAELHDQARALALKARDGKLTPDEMTGSSFTISNMGMLNVDQFNAIINPGESAILAVASTREEPAVKNGEIAVRSLMTMTLSADHRLVDGATGAAFINAIKAKLEDLELWKSLIS